MEADELDRTVRELRSSLSDLSLATMLYKRLEDLLPPTLNSSRLRLPGIVSRVTNVVHVSGPDPETQAHNFSTKTVLFGDVKIKTTTRLIAMKKLYLIHPWIHPLLDRLEEVSHDAAEVDATMSALRLLACLRQPFGGLLVEKVSRMDHKRVAADGLIMARVQEDVALSNLIGNICVIDVQ